MNKYKAGDIVEVFQHTATQDGFYHVVPVGAICRIENPIPYPGEESAEVYYCGQVWAVRNSDIRLHESGTFTLEQVKVLAERAWEAALEWEGDDSDFPMGPGPHKKQSPDFDQFWEANKKQ